MTEHLPGSVALLVYLAFMVVVGAWSARRMRDERDFFLAGQRLGLVVTGVATMSAAFSGFVFVGGPGLMYRDGIGSLFICLPIGLTPVLLGWLMGVRLRLFAEVPGVLTIPDVVSRRFGGSRAVFAGANAGRETGSEGAARSAAAGAAVAILFGSVAYLAAQLLALGVLLQVLLGWNLLMGVGVSLLVILAYSAAGGMVAGVWTDLAQGVLMLVAALAVFGLVLSGDGGLPGLVRSIAGSEAFGDGFFAPGRGSLLTGASLYFVFSVGTLAQPQMLHKLMMVRSLDKLRWLPLVLGGSQVACLVVWLGLGLAVPAAVARGLMPAVETADRAVPSYLLQVAPQAVAALVVVGVVAAVMSTADSFLNLAAGALRRDLPRALGRSRHIEPQSLSQLRWATVWIGLGAGALALGFGDLIALLGTFAFGVFAAGLAPALVVGLNWSGVTARAAAASIWVGILSAIGLELVRRLGPQLWEAFGLSGLVPSALALMLSLSILLAISWLDRRAASMSPMAQRILST